MAGIYIHIPFCKSRCIYCSFYSTTESSSLRERYINALCRELTDRKDYLQGEAIHTIYFGGGTPSQLTKEDLDLVFATLSRNYNLDDCEEITLEANPDDLSIQYLKGLSTLPINRISMGIQTFDDHLLKFLNRRHNSKEAIQAFNNARKVGFRNISIDLIYGLPGATTSQWMDDVEQALSLRPEHISAYSLSYEQGTPIYNMLNKHRINEIDEDKYLEFYTILMNELRESGYEHYEISNFCLPDYHSRHNSSYWHGIPYLGCGAAAHSFNGYQREWNIADLDLYIKGIETGERKFEKETLTENMQYNEMIMTMLRTKEGIDLSLLKNRFGNDYYNYCLSSARPNIEMKKMVIADNHLRLTRKGIFVSDDIISDMFEI